MNAQDAMTTFGGIGIALFKMVIKDTMRDRLAGKTEKMKCGELSQHTQLLQQLVQHAQKSRRQTKKANKKIQRKLGAIHKDVVLVKEQTAPK